MWGLSCRMLSMKWLKLVRHVRPGGWWQLHVIMHAVAFHNKLGLELYPRQHCAALRHRSFPAGVFHQFHARRLRGPRRFQFQRRTVLKFDQRTPKSPRRTSRPFPSRRVSRSCCRCLPSPDWLRVSHQTTSARSSRLHAEIDDRAAA